MVQDSSVDFQDTWDFLCRRMEDSAALGQARKQVSTQWAQFHGQEVLLHWVYTRLPDLIVMYWTVNSLQVFTVQHTGRKCPLARVGTVQQSTMSAGNRLLHTTLLHMQLEASIGTVTEFLSAGFTTVR